MPTAVLSAGQCLTRLARESAVPLIEEHAGPLWRRSDHLLEGSAWEDMIPRYTDYVHARRQPVGGACSLQHYTGRFFVAPILTWLATGQVLDLAHERWWYFCDEFGATRQVSWQDPSFLGEGSAEDLLAEMLRHISPYVDAVCRLSRITRRVALGGPAASAAGIFGLAWRSAAPTDRATVRRLGDAVLNSRQWGERAPLAVLDEITGAQQTKLLHRRTTCCLIRLGEGHGACAPCPQIPDREERLVASADAPASMLSAFSLAPGWEAA